MNDDNWFDCTVLGSQFEEQTSYSGQWRHRPLRLNLAVGRKAFGEERGIGDWRPGRAPTEEAISDEEAKEASTQKPAPPEGPEAEQAKKAAQ